MPEFTLAQGKRYVKRHGVKCVKSNGQQKTAYIYGALINKAGNSDGRIGGREKVIYESVRLSQSRSL